MNIDDLGRYYGGCFDIKKEVVFIFPHAFSDANHVSGRMPFVDYYSWFVETIKFIKNIKEVNWIVKPHPSSKVFNESGIVEGVLRKYSANSISLWKKNRVFNRFCLILSKRDNLQKNSC